MNKVIHFPFDSQPSLSSLLPEALPTCCLLSRLMHDPCEKHKHHIKRTESAMHPGHTAPHMYRNT